MTFFAQKKLTEGFFKLCALLPLPLLQGLAHLLAALAWHGRSVLRRVTETNLALCYPDKTPRERRQLARQSLYYTLLTSLEIPRIWYQPVDRTLAQVESIQGRELIDDARARGKGVIVIAPHLGNWEALGYFLARDYPITCLFKPQPSSWRNEIIHHGRSRAGTKLVPTNRKGVLAIARALKAGEVTGILPDQIPDKNSGVAYVPFFGRPTATMTLIPSLLQRGNAEAVAGFAKRLPDGRFRIIFQPVPQAIYHKDTNSAAAALNQTVEALIAQAPEQYQWEYKRFRRGSGYRKTAIYNR